METQNKTPNYIKKEDDNERIREELEDLLEKELEKSPDDINTDKIDSIILLLNSMDEKKEENLMDKEEFAKRYLKGYFIRTPGNIFTSGRIKAAGIVLIFTVLFGIGNYASVRATDKGILANVKDTIDIFYYDVIRKDRGENPETRNFSDIQQRNSLSENMYGSWEEVREKANDNFRMPYYIPEGFTEEDIHFQSIDGNDFVISRSYYLKEKYIRFYISGFQNDGKTSTHIDGVEKTLYKKFIGELYVICYQIEESIHAIFQEGIFVYEIETNVSEDELEQIILGMGVGD